ncbi:T9SS type A sorting domain-containing protein [Taibaiella koreensis]|uniref:T9SS type A sorting domain-containing protein n=1 Tax=Taibaiella koreensis TaxID=1268548 RepID=UPI000E59B501|nr:T9SS type A sorting domain-containing protein [Taibaiella koreensis]
MNRIRHYASCFSLLFLTIIQAAQAQNIDLFAEIDMDAHPNLCPGKIFGDTTTDRGPKGVWSMGSYGPATVYENTEIWYLNSMSRFLTPHEQDSLGTGPGSYWIQKLLIQENVEAPDYLNRESDRPVNDIGILLDWTAYQNGTIKYLAPPYTADTAYGFFVHVLGAGDGPDDLQNDDNNTDNNWAVKKIVWGCDPVSIGELLRRGERLPLTLFPNPASDKISFNFNTAQAFAPLDITIRSITGHVALHLQQRAGAAGSQQLSVDLAAAGLNEGLYLLEIYDGRQYASGRFALIH